MSREDLLESQSMRQQKLDQLLDDTADEKLWEKHIVEYLEDLRESQRTYSLASDEFDGAGIGWLNCDTLKFDEHLRNRLSLLDFFTYCCVNCMHIFPYLHELEGALPKEDFIVIGVHSAKFDNEKLNENVKRAILRHDIRHPVLNDPEMKLWSLCQIVCWPTLMLLGPRGEVLYKFVGEKNMDRLIPYMRIFVTYFGRKSELQNRNPLPMKPLEDASGTNRLSCPSKVAVDGKTRTWAAADSANNRVLIFSESPSSTVSDVVGSGEAALVDGTFGSCRFHYPQGICFFDNGLYVADTGNHAIRKVDFVTKTVTTIVGTGKQGRDLIGGAVEGPLQELATPWDVVLYQESLLIIAMAGSHQIWAYATKEDFRLFGGKVVVKDKHCLCIAGSGREENRNTSYPLKAGFAQPSGLALDGEERILYIADSESSSIRMMDMHTGAVKNVCGGALDPMELFAFGDEDGRARDVRLQHPLAVVWDPLSHELIVADSYNHKLKLVDPKQRSCSTIPAITDLREPGGLAFDAGGKILFVADTENHRLRGFSTDDYEVVLSVGPMCDIADSNRVQDFTDSENSRLNFVQYEDGVKVQPVFTLRVGPKLGENTALTEGAPQTCKLRGNKLSLQWKHPATVDVAATVDVDFRLDCQFVICNDEDKTCSVHKVSRHLKFEQVEEGGHRAVEVPIHVR